MKILTVRNRHPKVPFAGMYDGVPYEVADKLSLPDFVARHLQKQSLIRDNPVSGAREFRLAIVEEDEKDGPLPNIEELPIESLDRSDFLDFRKVVYVDISRQNRPLPPAERGSGRDTQVLTSSKER